MVLQISDDCPIDLDESIFKLVRTNYKQKRPTSKQELAKFYIAAIKRYVASDIVEAKRISRIENRRTYVYTLNKQLVLYHLELNSLKNSMLNNINDQYANIYFDKHGADAFDGCGLQNVDDDTLDA